MKRLLALPGLLPLAAILLVPASAGAQSPLPSIAHTLPQQVTIAVSPRRDRSRPYTFTTTGRIVPPPRYCGPGEDPLIARCVAILCPPGATGTAYCLFPGRAIICSGTVDVRFQRGARTISSRTVRVSNDCTYRSRVSFRLRLPGRVGNLRVRSRFSGNAVLLPRSSAARTVRAG